MRMQGGASARTAWLHSHVAECSLAAAHRVWSTLLAELGLNRIVTGLIELEMIASPGRDEAALPFTHNQRCSHGPEALALVES